MPLLFAEAGRDQRREHCRAEYVNCKRPGLGVAVKVEEDGRTIDRDPTRLGGEDTSSSSQHSADQAAQPSRLAEPQRLVRTAAAASSAGLADGRGEVCHPSRVAVAGPLQGDTLC